MMTQYNKWKSRKWLVTIWAIILTSIIVGYALIAQYEATWIGVTLPLLIAIPSVYIVGNSYIKTHIKE